MLIRKIEKPDNGAMAEIIQTVMTEFGAVGEGYSIEDAEVHEMFEAYSSPSSVYYIIEDNKRVIGGGGIAPLAGSAAKDAICELKKMYFLQEARGHGYGKLLGEMLLVDAARKGYRGYSRVIVEALEFYLAETEAKESGLRDLLDLRGSWSRREVTETRARIAEARANWENEEG